jgi:phenylalanyl-tRNA synthetase beta chain
VKVPLGWAREFAPADLDVEELSELLTHRGVKVEGIERPWAGLEGVVVVRVLEVRDHPNSDKLCVARIQHAAGEIELVVGVRNMTPGDLVPWAPPGARVPVLDEPLGTREIRGVVSNGMLCSPRELAISTDHGGILVLPADGWDVGADVASGLQLDLPVLDIEVEPNRPDLLCVYGVAREIALVAAVPLAVPELEVAETDERATDVASVRIDAEEACPRYLARILRGIRHQPSPLLAQARLTACGMRPIDAVVDATNYAMLELGQPLHAFDLATLRGPGIVVRHAREAEHLTTLDDVDRALEPSDLLICDLERPVALAGVMGGQTSEVSSATTDVLLESAYFRRGGILRTARRLDLHSEASHRFERGTDPEALDAAATRAAALIASWTGATVATGVTSAGAVPSRHWVGMRPARAESLLGYPVSSDDAVAVFDALGMAHRDNHELIEVEVPGYRTDIDAEVDLIEEVVRIQGYERVGSTMPRAPHPGGMTSMASFASLAKDALVRVGLREVRPVPFVAQADLELFGDTDAVPVANPLRAEEGFLRTRLTPGLLRTVARNIARGVQQIAIFEVGTTFRLADPFLEQRKLGFALCGPAGTGWDDGARAFDVLDAKGVIDSVLDDLGVERWELGAHPGDPFHPGRAASVTVGGRHAGVFGEIHPGVAAALGIDGRVAVGVLGLAPLFETASELVDLRDVPRFPPVRRDLAFVVPSEVPVGAVAAAITEAGGAALSRRDLFDVFEGAPLAAGDRSLAFAIELRDPERTLTDEEAQAVIDRIVEHVRAACGGLLRTG